MRGRVVLGGVLLASAIAHADVDYARAAEVYGIAESELANGQYDNAVRDYGEAYEITKDPVVFYKIGLANEKAGKCAVALAYYARYLKEAKPDPKFVGQTQEHIETCGGPKVVTAPADPVQPVVQPPAPPTPTPPPTPPPVAPPPVVPHTQVVVHGHGDRAAWLLVGGAVTAVTIGAVMAYAAHSSEADVSDLYVGLNGKPPAYDAKTQQQYTDLLSKGADYQHYAWTAFSIAGAAAIAATIVFVRGRGDDTTVQVAPTASANAAGVTAAFRF